MFLNNRFNPLIKGSYILETSGNVFNDEHFYLNKLSFKKIIIDTCSMWSCSIFSSTSASCESARDNVACSSALPVKHQVIILIKISVEGGIYSKGGSILVDGDTTSCKGALSHFFLTDCDNKEKNDGTCDS